jgi:hypothetical protein
MKKAIIFLLVMLPMMVMSQTVVKGYYKNFAGAAEDTLTSSVTKSWIIDVGNTGGWSGKVYDVTFQILNDKVTDSLYYTLKFYPSVDGITFPRQATDSTAVVKAIVDRIYLKTLTAQSARYWRITEVATSLTQKSQVFGYVSLVVH